MMLEMEGVHAHYGHIHALRGIDVEVQVGEIVTLIGANGAGKSTLMMSLFGNPKASAGRIVFDGEDITRVRGHARVGRGISLTPEGRGIFPAMTVLENLDMGAYARPKNQAEYDEDMDRVFTLFPRLKEREKQLGGTMSGGEQQMLAIGRALMLSPRMLLLDEPSLGLAPLIVRGLFETMHRVNEELRTTMLIVEQNANLALKIAQRAYVIETGRFVFAGSAEEVQSDESVRRAYLGY